VKEVVEWSKSILFALIAVLIIRSFIGLPYLVSGESMNPNFDDRDRLIVDRIVYEFGTPQREDVIIFHAPRLDGGKDLIKRVIGLPGDVISVTGDIVCVNKECGENTYLHDAIQSAKIQGATYNLLDYPETKVPDGHVFVMGDNRSNSTDSRFEEVGMVPFSDIIGRVDFIFWKNGWIQ